MSNCVDKPYCSRALPLCYANIWQNKRKIYDFDSVDKRQRIIVTLFFVVFFYFLSGFFSFSVLLEDLLCLVSLSRKLRKKINALKSTNDVWPYVWGYAYYCLINCFSLFVKIPKKNPHYEKNKRIIFVCEI